MTPGTQAAAARLVVALNKKRGVRTPKWIRELADSDPIESWSRPPDGRDDDPQDAAATHRTQAAFARWLVALDKQRGVETPDWIRELADSDPIDAWAVEHDEPAGDGGTGAGKRAS